MTPKSFDFRPLAAFFRSISASPRRSSSRIAAARLGIRMYLADRGSRLFYLSYKRPWLNGSKDDAYAYYASSAEVPMAFRYFRDSEPLATGVSHWKAPANGFNPWRDQPIIERNYLKEVPGVDRLPPFLIR